MLTVGLDRARERRRVAGDEDRRRGRYGLASGVEEGVRRAPGRLRSTRGAPVAVTRESGRFGDRRRRRNLGGGGTCGGAKLSWRRSRAGRRVRAWRSWRRQWRGMGKAQGCGQFKGGPRASWGSVPWRRGAILGEKGGVRCAAGEMDLAGGATASAAAGACGC